MDIELGGLVGVYSRAEERTVLVVFDARALGIGRETAEASEVRAFAPADLHGVELTCRRDGTERCATRSP